jgi:hypothetical protein
MTRMIAGSPQREEAILVALLVIASEAKQSSTFEVLVASSPRWGSSQ